MIWHEVMRSPLAFSPSEYTRGGSVESHMPPTKFHSLTVPYSSIDALGALKIHKSESSRFSSITVLDYSNTQNGSNIPESLDKISGNEVFVTYLP
jgi:hypothetical protein